MESLDKIIISATDSSVAEYKSEIISYLEDYYRKFDTHAMNEDQAAFLRGQNDMLLQIIKFLKRN